MSILRLSDVTASYGLAKALFGVSLTLEQGETVGLLGRNGAGKTTLLKSVIAEPSVTVAGEIAIDDRALRGLPTYRISRHGVAWVPDDRRVFTALSVRENLELAHTKNAPADQLAKVVASVPLVGRLLSRRGYELSGGEQQAVSIARALMSAPRFVLMDEPTEGLAPLIVEQLQESIARLPSEFGVGILLAEQNFAFVAALAQRVAIVSTGRVAWTGSTSELENGSDLIDRYLSAGASQP
ncbi:amino acid/amide ABC transporter ATP-binding protein 2, HAAT family [Micromonospora pallida]|uniref:Amino acid/amide ABC transporter ATP-binding protein 2, HAAT family n=1 Tax=Micromonospora pallida TaxID=145854 RepID=A0A1C6RSH4_9ACTN|nr:ABC transporter ATP-binding protein [Micromonospora pallida]SCL20171.1 amino acid/amide ABC transporter ATP-binding protein 2, HAAT family [Micromonospora pallida]